MVLAASYKGLRVHRICKSIPATYYSVRDISQTANLRKPQRNPIKPHETAAKKANHYPFDSATLLQRIRVSALGLTWGSYSARAKPFMKVQSGCNRWGVRL